METNTSLLKRIILHYRMQRNTELRRQIDVLISKTSPGCSLKFFNPSDVFAEECVACLVNLISDPTTKSSLILKLSDSHIRACVHETFELTPALVSVVVSRGASTRDTMTAEAMQLLQKVTYGRRITFQESYMEELVRFLLSNVVSPAMGLTQPAMGILVNLTRDNFSVQSFIKNNENTKHLTKCLIDLLIDQTSTVMVFSLTLLLNLCWHEKLTSTFFNYSNVLETFQTVFNNLIGDESGDTIRSYAVDLFKDILKKERLQKILAEYEYLGDCIEETLSLISRSSAESVVKIFELLQSFCHIDSVRRVVCKAMFAKFQIQCVSQFPDLVQTTLSQIDDPLLATIHWAGQSTDTNGLAPLGAYDLLVEIYEELIFAHNTVHYEKHVSAVLPTVLQTLQTPLEGDNINIRKRCSAIVKCVKLLLTFCQDKNLLTCTSKKVYPKLLSKLLYFQFDHNPKAIASDITPPTDDWRYSLRVNLRQKSEKISKTPKKSTKDYYEEYRKRLKSETARYEEYKKQDCLKKKKYRHYLTGEKRNSYNEKSKLRMRAYRQRLKAKASVDKPSTRHKVAKLREYWRFKKRQERGRLTSDQKRINNERKRERYKEKAKKRLNFEVNTGYQSQTPKKTSSRYLPKKTEKFADVMNEAVNNATPRRKKALINKGIILSNEEKLKIESESKIVARVKRALKQLKHQQTKEGRKRYRLMTHSLVGRYAVEHQLRKALEIKWEYWLRMSALDENDNENVKRSDAFSDETVKCIESFFEYESVTLPCKKTVSSKTLKQKRVLTDTLQQVHKRFVQEHPHLKVSLSHFRKLRPKEVLTIRNQKFATCLCEYCLNAQFKLDVLNRGMNARDLGLKFDSKYHAVEISLCAMEKEFVKSAEQTN